MKAGDKIRLVESLYGFHPNDEAIPAGTTGYVHSCNLVKKTLVAVLDGIGTGYGHFNLGFDQVEKA